MTAKPLIYAVGAVGILACTLVASGAKPVAVGVCSLVLTCGALSAVLGVFSNPGRADYANSFWAAMLFVVPAAAIVLFAVALGMVIRRVVVQSRRGTASANPQRLRCAKAQSAATGGGAR